MDTEGGITPRQPYDRDQALIRGMSMIKSEMTMLNRNAVQMTQHLQMLPTVQRGLGLVKRLGTLHTLFHDDDIVETDLVVKGVLEHVLRLETKVKTKYANLDRTYRRLRDLQSRRGADDNSYPNGHQGSSVSSSRTSSSQATLPWTSWGDGKICRCIRSIIRTWANFWRRVRKRSRVKRLVREVTLRLRCEEEIGEGSTVSFLEMVTGWYNAYVRLTFMYFTLMVLMLYVALGLGWTIVRVIDMFVTLQQPSAQTSWSFMVVPIQIVMMSMGVSSMCTLFQDQVREVPLANVRATLLALYIRIFRPKDPYPSEEQLVFADVIFIANSFAWPAIWWQPVLGSFGLGGVRGEAQAEVAAKLNSSWGFLDHDPRTGVVLYLSSVTLVWLVARLGHLILDFAAMCRREGSVDAGYLTYRIQRGLLQTKMFVGTFLVDWMCNRHAEAFLLFLEESDLRKPPAAEAQRAQLAELETELTDALLSREGHWAKGEQDLVRFFKEQVRNPEVLKSCGMLYMYLDDFLQSKPVAGHAAESNTEVRRYAAESSVGSNSTTLRRFTAEKVEKLLFLRLAEQEEKEAVHLLDTRLRAMVWTIIWTLAWAFTVMVSFSIQATVGTLAPVIGFLYVIIRFCGHHPTLVFVATVAFFLVYFRFIADFSTHFTPKDIDTWWSWRIVLMPVMVYILQSNWVTIRGRAGNFVEVMTSFLLVAPIIIVMFVEHERTDLSYSPYPLIGPWGMSSDFAANSPYPVCQLEWGGDAYKLNILDLGALTFYTYAQDFPQLESMLQTSYGGVDFRLHVNLSSQTYTDPLDPDLQILPTAYVLSFPPNETNKTGTLVVAFRGTHTQHDFYADAASYTSVAILQGFQWYAFPILWDVPQKFIEWALVQSQTQQQVDMVEAAVERVRGIVGEFPNYSVVLTGHSLGGWFAEIIGIRLGLPTVSWSGMGMSLRSQAERLEGKSHNKYVVVVPDGDAVPRIDRHAGLTQQIPCPKQESVGLKIMNFTFYASTIKTSVECHKVDRSTCELWRSCGDSKKRGFVCQGYVPEDDRGMDMPAEVLRNDS